MNCNFIIIKVRKTQNAWVALSLQLHAEVRDAQQGEGSTPQEAIGNFFLSNAKHFGIRSAHYDMTDALTSSHVNTQSISNTKLL